MRVMLRAAGPFSTTPPTERSAHMATGPLHQAGQRSQATDEVSFYDESLKKQIEGTFVSDGTSEYGTKSVSYSDLGECIDYNSQVL